jgi:hypothetical protein
LLPDGRVFVASTDNAQIYDSHSGIFTPTGPYLGQNPGFGNLITVTLLTNGKVLLTGCADDCINVVAELFDPQSGTFGMTGPLMATGFPDYGGYISTLLADGRVLFLGSDEWPFPADAEFYDPATGTFASIGGPILNAYATASRVADGTVLITGGLGGNGDAYSSLYVPASDTFEYAGEMTVGRVSHTATPLPDDTVLITGGFSIGPNPTSSAEVYKP